MRLLQGGEGQGEACPALLLKKAHHDTEILHEPSVPESEMRLDAREPKTKRSTKGRGPGRTKPGRKKAEYGQ